MDAFKTELLKIISNKKDRFTLLGVVVLILAIPLGVYLVKQQQILRSRASGEEITFKMANGSPLPVGSDGLAITDSLTVKVDLAMPTPTASPTTSPTPTASPTPSPSATPTASNPYIMQALLFKDGHYEERKCPVNTNAGYGINTPENGACISVRNIASVANTIEDVSMFVGDFQSKKYMFQALLFKDGHYEERRCPINPNARWGIDFPESSGQCTLHRSVAGVANSVKGMAMFVAEYQGKQYAMQSLLFKDGHYEERRCPINANAGYGIDTPENGACILFRNIAGVANTVEDVSTFTGIYQGSPSMFQALLFKDGHYEERRCALNSNAGFGIELVGGQCTLHRSVAGVANSVKGMGMFEGYASSN